LLPEVEEVIAALEDVDGRIGLLGVFDDQRCWDKLIAIADDERSRHTVKSFRIREALACIRTNSRRDPDVVVIRAIPGVPAQRRTGPKGPACNAKIEVGETIVGMVDGCGHVIDLSNSGIVDAGGSANPPEIESEYRNGSCEQVGCDRVEERHGHGAAVQGVRVTQNDAAFRVLRKVPTGLQLDRRRDPDRVHRRVAIQTAAATRITKPVTSEATRR